MAAHSGAGAAHGAAHDEATPGERVRRLRRKRGLSQAELGAAAGIAPSTISRLEHDRRQARLELLQPLARALGIGIEVLVGTGTPDPRVHTRAARRGGVEIQPLGSAPGPLQTFKTTIDAATVEPTPMTHDGYEWLYVLSGRLRLVLGEHDLVLAPGEVAEFDTRTPHWLGSTGDGPVEVLSIFGPTGRRMHLRAAPRGRRA